MMDRKLLYYIINEAFKEATEATGSGSAGGFVGKMSLFSDDKKAKSEYKRLDENDYCDECGENKDNCVCSKKVEAKEGTGVASSGSYETPFFLAKNLKNWAPSKKTQIPGGSFVSVKDKCKTFPYCNQGIGALEFSSNGEKTLKKMTKRKPKSNIKEAISNVSKKTGLSEDDVINILLKEISNILK
jgi:hypothetical protein